MRYALLPLTLCAVFSFTAANAQPPAQDDGWSLTIGAGALYAPTYVGDDEYRLSLLPNVRIGYGDRFFASVQEGVGYNVINEDGFRIGPIARIAFSRDEDGSQPFAVTGERSNDLIGLGDVGTTIELGGFITGDLGPLTARVEGRQGVNGHEGFVVDASLSYSGRYQPAGPPLIYSIGPRIKLVDDNYNSAYFDVTPGQALASGLPVFDAEGGVHSLGAGATVIAPLTRDNKMSLVFIAGYDRLVGDAADNPLVVQRGSRNQATAGVFFSYKLF